MSERVKLADVYTDDELLARAAYLKEVGSFHEAKLVLTILHLRQVAGISVRVDPANS